ncbi:DNA mismatch repair protein MutS [Aerococcus urinaehominis]|uniref:DNA mismatch repair protein MutS n=1 Tax=Aerococcus urinaehominis TaxID=128944 RepID=A0A0X8FLU7_9LACT|nr:DNA mismatch repair protein MutS [Aerococcus urinaehominis]AMB99691.1 DNA mismatch repair protein MutS [Aerococcus urinaehominis]SDL90713.1 DNA mismatch repair protein MutS [Aerococcus urinaehominis]
MAKKDKQTPMMAQYLEMKSHYQDAFLFYRLGDFYELFYEDAEQAAQILEITLTSRNKNADNPIPMCGVPYHSADDYIESLINKGYKVAIAEQMEDPKLAKGMVERQVVRVLTPGTYLDKRQGHSDNNFLVALINQNQAYHLAHGDVGTGELRVTSLKHLDSVITELNQLAAKELVLGQEWPADQLNALTGQNDITISYHQMTDESAEFAHILSEISQPVQRHVVSLLLDYVQETQFQSLDYWQIAQAYEVDHYLMMDHFAKQNLELTSSIRKQSRQGSLLAFLDQTKTAMGGRKLKQWLERPLINQEQIERRHDQVADLIDFFFQRRTIQDQLKNVYDLERLVAKIGFGNVNPRELLQLKRSLLAIPDLLAGLQDIEASSHKDMNWQDLLAKIDDLPEIVDLIGKSVDEDSQAVLKDGGVIKDGFNSDLDRYRQAMRHGKTWIAELQASEREATGIKSLKIGFNKVFGYYIEVTKANLQHLDPDRYERKQTLTNAERFITPELKKVEQEILEAQDRSLILEHQLFIEVRDQVKTYSSQLQQLAAAVAELDVLQSFAEVSENYQFCRPKLQTGSHQLKIVQGRHPVVEQVIGHDQFVANDLEMGPELQTALITGPNMSGKSTFMRQVGLIVIMAQMGCFVPCQEAELPIFDKIFTRIGAADDLLAGQSTFMVEMMEANQALQKATDNSLLLFDEIGRGTSTYDGIALAQAILEYLNQHLRAKVLFSTHFHELTKLAEKIKGLENIHVGAVEEDGEVIFLHKIYPGAADQSYGIHVAKLAGMPQELLQNAQGILAQLEADNQAGPGFDCQVDASSVAPIVSQDQADLGGTEVDSVQQLSLFTADSDQDLAYQEILEKIRQVSLYQMTPLEAQLFINDLQNDLKGVDHGHS